LQALFAVGFAAIFTGHGETLKNHFATHEIKPMLGQIGQSGLRQAL
jgi:hypothetical protein